MKEPLIVVAGLAGILWMPAAFIWVNWPTIEGWLPEPVKWCCC